MPAKKTVQRAVRDKRQGKAPTTQAGEFVREEMHHIREGKHGARSTKQAIAIGLSKARRAGVALPPPKKGRGARSGSSSSSGRRRSTTNPRRARATLAALQREPRAAASTGALVRQARSAARRRSARDRSASARKAARTKGPVMRAAAARKAARTRARNRRQRA